MSRPRKNVKRIDPRYFLDETAHRDEINEIFGWSAEEKIMKLENDWTEKMGRVNSVKIDGDPLGMPGTITIVPPRVKGDTGDSWATALAIYSLFGLDSKKGHKYAKKTGDAAAATLYDSLNKRINSDGLNGITTLDQWEKLTAAKKEKDQEQSSREHTAQQYEKDKAQRGADRQARAQADAERAELIRQLARYGERGEHVETASTQELKDLLHNRSGQYKEREYLSQQRER
ncbi:hypothetical protein CMI47_21385 [Candidatus Pacearchaeota archaeon]|nr:hypothetical protein [Candidatus Pacearchaeota archaeon]|tara:strand:- start:577 stop:1269 length:693 start_codon:yes stop_codon:yes gene_type:complete